MSGFEEGLVAEAFRSNWIAPLGPMVDDFEREMCEYIGIGHAAALSSGTAALHLALIILGVGDGDEVLCSDLTFSASANAIVYVGAKPVFIDCDRRTWNMDPGLLEEELEEARNKGRMPKAVMAVDLYGQCVDYGRIEEICRRYDVPLIEDAAEALGASCNGKKAGCFGRAGVFSFNGNKIITTSGGGMLVSDDGEFVDRARFLATQAREPAPHYEHSKIGYNYRMSNLLAAVGRGQLRVIEERVAARRGIFDYYRKALGDLPGIDFMPEAPYGRSNRWLTCITVEPEDFGSTREDIRMALEAENIEARPIWKPMHMQPVFAGCRKRRGAVAAEIFDKGLCLPSGSRLEEKDLDRIAEVVRRVALSSA
ncbi:MAG: aminotransferase class I/II-fold pyridoxal phosphate-dependent enzyme [Acidobacteriota bacterium]|nr:aminotransferase class I/II-fold pyridoxal phosphate-dependent enzyme [Acidobacteriota bacterium]